MDSYGFRNITSPSYYQHIQTVIPRPGSSRPGPDPRYKDQAGRMEDGRGITDYRSRCEENIPAGNQYATKRWMQTNAKTIINTSRLIQMQQTGAYQGVRMDLEPRAAQEVTCTAYGCKAVTGAYDTGIGMERLESVPHLFGTFEPPLGANGPRLTQPTLTTKYEGGRNTPRGGSSRNAVGVDDPLPGIKGF